MKKLFYLSIFVLLLAACAGNDESEVYVESSEEETVEADATEDEGANATKDNSTTSRGAGYIVTLITPDGTEKILCPDDWTILDRAEFFGIDLPYSCRCGAETSSLAYLESGRVDQSDQSFLHDSLTERGWILLDVAYPMSDCTIYTHQEGNSRGWKGPRRWR